MKRLKSALGVLLVLSMIILSLAACGSSSAENATSDKSAESTVTESGDEPVQESEKEVSETSEPNTNASESTDREAGNDILVIYFSRTGEQYGVGVIDEGNTAIVAKMIAEATGADTFEILPEDDYYPTTYDELTDVAKREQNEKARPQYAGSVPDLSQYSTIFIGAPVWWGDWPMICYTFFENEELSGKALYPFSTHAGSGLAGFDKKLSSAVPGSTVGEGLAIAGTDAQNDPDGVKSKVTEWLSNLDY